MRTRSILHVFEAHRLGIVQKAPSNEADAQEGHVQIFRQRYLFATRVDERESFDQSCNWMRLGGETFYQAHDVAGQTREASIFVWCHTISVSVYLSLVHLNARAAGRGIERDRWEEAAAEGRSPAPWRSPAPL